jgi:hypothetical protein
MARYESIWRYYFRDNRKLGENFDIDPYGA